MTQELFVSDVYAGVQFDWDSLTSVFWSPSASGVKFPTPSPQEPGARNIYCPEAAHVLLAMAHIMVNEVSTWGGEGRSTLQIFSLGVGVGWGWGGVAAGTLRP